MTVEETIEYFKNNNERIRSAAIDENRTSKFMKETIDANNMAIKSLESWEKVKKEIHNLADDFDYYSDTRRINGLRIALDIIENSEGGRE